MEQGFISDEARCLLSDDDKDSLDMIRHGLINSISLELVDRSYEAMGSRFRERVNRRVVVVN